MRQARRRSRGQAGRALIGVLLLLAARPPNRLPAQAWRVAAWGTYEGVTDADDWSVLGGQLSLVSLRGDGAWIAAERLGRFGAQDVAVRIGGVLHPAPRWWVTAEAASAVDPDFAPKNAWEADVAALVAPRVSVGLGYRRQNYVVGAVDVVMPHLSVEVSRVSWDTRVFISRNPSDRTDVAFFGRATIPLGRRGAAWLGGGAGRESYLVGTAPTQSVRSLETMTAVVGVRYNAGGGTTVRLEASVVRSEPVLSRRGVGLAIERSF